MTLSAKSVESAADALRGPDVTLPGAVRWLRRRIRAVRTVLAHVAPESAVTTIGAIGTELGLGKRSWLLGLRRSLSSEILSQIPAPLGFRSARVVGRQQDDNRQQMMGPDGEATSDYGLAVEGNQVRWNIRSNNVLPKSRPPPKICFGSGGRIAVCKTAVPVFISNGSGGSASIVRSMDSTSAPS